MPSDDAAYGLHLLDEKIPTYQRFRDYDAGIQPWMFASDKLLEVAQQVMNGYRLNICRPVSRGVSRRLNIDTWDGDEQAAAWWTDDAQRLQNRHHREVLRQGDGYLLTWPTGTMESGPLRTHRLRADEAIVVYREEDPDTPEYGVKAWTVADRGDRLSEEVWLRVNVLYPDHVERYVSRSKVKDGFHNLEAADLVPYVGDDGSQSEIRYAGTLKAAGSDGILPLQHFAAQADSTPYGTSILEDVTPVQDELNHTVRSLLTAMEGYALPMRVFTAFAADQESHIVRDPVTGEDVQVNSSNVPDYHPFKDWALWLPGENSKAWQLDAADLAQLLEVRRAAIQNGTLTSGVPLGLLAEDSGEAPSGVALRVIESPLTDLVVDVQQDVEVPYRNTARLHGWEAAPSWSSPITMDDTEKAAYAQQLIDLGVPAPKAVEEAGLMDAEAFLDAREEFADVEAGFGDLLVQAERAGVDPAELVR